MKSTKLVSLLSLAALVIILFSCKKDEGYNEKQQFPPENEHSALKVQLTDRPDSDYLKTSTLNGYYEAVNVEIIQVSVNYRDSADGDYWVNLPTHAGIYNLIELNNALVVIAEGGELPPGHITQMRLLLGHGNTVVIDSVAFDLKTPSGQETGLKINLDFLARPGMQYVVLLDFDASHSIVKLGNGGFILKPVIHVASIIEIEKYRDMINLEVISSEN